MVQSQTRYRIFLFIYFYFGFKAYSLLIVPSNISSSNCKEPRETYYFSVMVIQWQGPLLIASSKVADPPLLLPPGTVDIDFIVFLDLGLSEPYEAESNLLYGCINLLSLASA